MSDIIKQGFCDVAIIGAGPTGIAAALELKNSGINNIIILDRETEGGGVPRHCGHPPFGLLEYKRIMTGPAYARRNVEAVQQANIQLSLKTSVTSLGPGGTLEYITPTGGGTLKAKRILLATGTRETSRAARFISGDRPLGICNTGALQSMVYLKNMVPFRRPLIVGTEIVSFSALWTCKKAGIKPVAMIEEQPGAQVAWPIHYSTYYFGVPLLTGTTIKKISGNSRVRSVLLVDIQGKEQDITCDGVLVTGKFTPESTLARMAGLKLDPLTGLPVTDNKGRCSDKTCFAAGNVTNHPVKVAGQCWQHGRRIARQIAKDLTR